MMIEEVDVRQSYQRVDFSHRLFEEGSVFLVWVVVKM